MTVNAKVGPVSGSYDTVYSFGGYHFVTAFYGNEVAPEFTPFVIQQVRPLLVEEKKHG